MVRVNKHNYHSHNYKRPTFCAHCNGLLVGLVKQGLRCKRCAIDVHERCKDDLKETCIHMVVGQHNFRTKTYNHPTYCHYCKKLLVGIINQGIKCTECRINMHEKCVEFISTNCDKTRIKKTEENQEVMRKTSATDSTSLNNEKKQYGTTDEEPQIHIYQDARVSIVPRKSLSDIQFDRMATIANREHTLTSEKEQEINGNEVVGEVVKIMKRNADNLDASDHEMKVETKDTHAHIKQIPPEKPLQRNWFCANCCFWFSTQPL